MVSKRTPERCSARAWFSAKDEDISAAETIIAAFALVVLAFLGCAALSAARLAGWW